MNKLTMILAMMLLLLVSSVGVFAADAKCALGEVYANGIGCVQPKIDASYSVGSSTGIASSIGGQIDAIRIDNPFTAPGQPVLVELTVSNIGATYPFNLIPLPPNQYAFIMTVDPVDKILYKQADGTFARYDITSAKWGSWFGSDWFARGYYYLGKAILDFKTVTSNDLCKYEEVGGLFPDFAKKQFVYDNYKEQMIAKYGELTDDEVAAKITAEDVKQYFPAVYEWDCIRSVDKQSFDNEIKTKYCKDTVTMGCMADYMKDNQGKLKTSSFVILTDKVTEGKCEYSKTDGVTYCGVGKDGICPPGATACNGKSSYTYEFVLLTPADAPALSPQEFQKLIDSGQITGDFKTTANGEQYNYGFTQTAQCPDDDQSGACHTLNVRVQAVNKDGISALFKSMIVQGAAFTGVGGIIGTAVPVVGTITGIIAGAISGLSVGLVKGIMMWGQYEIIGAPIYEGQGIFYVVAPALKVAATFTLYFAILVGAAGSLLLTRKTA